MRERFDGFQVRAADDPASIVAIVLDTTVGSWFPNGPIEGDEAARTAAKTLQSVAEQLLTFINTFLLLHDANRICILMSSPGTCDLVYPTFPDVEHLPAQYDINGEDESFDASPTSLADRPPRDVSAVMHDVRTAITTGIKDQLDRQSNNESLRNSSGSLSAALARALCLLNRAHQLHARRSVSGHGSDAPVTSDTLNSELPSMGRVLALVANRDNLGQYVPMMNCIFSAQRLGIPVDSCIVSDSDSTYFQQAAHLTNGVCVRVARDGDGAISDGLLQTLQTVFLVDRQGRDLIAMPAPERVDFRASCMQTKKIIEEGFTCSVCLSTFDPSVGKGAAMCPVCNARFAVLGRPKRRPPRPT